ncbi:MAG: radical SAM protein [Acidimicrobiales bacterium]|nr:radical SAM protein [Acidimicrobiales bacterium]
MSQETICAGLDDFDPTQRIATSRATMVAISIDGIVLPRTSRSPAVPLDLVGLLLLSRLSAEAEVAAEAADAIATQFGLAADAVLELIALLVERGSLYVDDGTVDPGRSATEVAPERDQTPARLAIAPGERYVLAIPTVFRIHHGSYEHRYHDGRLALALDAAELVAAASWSEPCTSDEAYSRLTAEAPSIPLDRSSFDEVTERMRGAQLVQPFDSDHPGNGNSAATAEENREAIRRHMVILHATDVAIDRHDAEASARPDHQSRLPVIPIHDNWMIPPLSLGLIVANAKAHRNGALEEHYDFVPRWLVQPAKVAEICERPAMFLFSNYIWNSGANKQLSATIKAASPNSITVHGGPDTPKYEADVERFFRDNPHVDITVRGEGEATFAEMLDALAGRAGDGPPDLSPLRDVAGLSFRLGEQIITTPDRDRITDVDSIPSPYLTGLFDSFAAGPGRAAMIETNRGCPYGCTFCDWGSATNSRIRKFDIDRVFAEIEWCAQRGFDNISLCDANFGIFERDVAIAEKFAEARRNHGFPLTVGNNYAKNTVKHIKDIIRIFADDGIIAEGIVSLQSLDTDTLNVIRRKNIKVEKYTDLAAQFTANRLPLAVDLMMALPGSTVDSYKHDLQACTDRDVRTRVHPTTMLTNSPMNDPEYRAEHGIVALPGEYVKRTNTFDEDDWQHMWELRHVYLLCDLFSVLRQVARYVRSEVGTKEVAFYEKLMLDAYAAPERWPTIAFTFQAVADLMVPPCSWSLFIDEVGEYLRSELGLPDDAALETVLAAQLLHLPARDRQHFPQTMEAAHDIAAWHLARVAACEAGHLEDWEQRVPPLRSFGPGQLAVYDPEDICRTAMGGDVTTFGISLTAWDIESRISRPRSTNRHEIASGQAAEEASASPSSPAGTPVQLLARPAAN